MANDMADAVRDALGNVVRDALKNVGDATPTRSKSGPLSGAKGVAAGVGLAAAAPIVAKQGIKAIRSNGKLPTPKPGKMAKQAASKATDRVGDKMKEVVSDKVEAAGGAGGLVKEAASGLLPFGGGGDGGGGKGGLPGVGKGRRMPVQQAVDVAVPIETAYNQWTQFEDWPTFMHRVARVTQEDDCTVGFATKMWGKTKEFTAKIETQRPDERIKWRVSQGITHTGVVTFHELAPRLTRIELNLDVDPGSLIEKAARGMRHVKRAARADLHRFKAFIEMQELETGAWRGVIEDGELVEPHDPAYDEERDYSDIDDLVEQASSEDEDEEQAKSEDEDEDRRDHEGEHPTRAGGNGSGRERTERFTRQAERASGTRAKSESGTKSKSGSSDQGSEGRPSGRGRSRDAESKGSGKTSSSNRRRTTTGGG